MGSNMAFAVLAICVCDHENLLLTELCPSQAGCMAWWLATGSTLISGQDGDGPGLPQVGPWVHAHAKTMPSQTVPLFE